MLPTLMTKGGTMADIDVSRPGRALSGKTALVTGAGNQNGLGRSIALALAAEGAAVAVADLALGTASPNPRDGAWNGVTSVAEELQERGTRAIAIAGDVSDPGDVRKIVSSVEQELGRIDVLVNNAAAPHGDDRTWSWLVPEPAYQRVMDINVKGTFLMSTEVLRRMLKKGIGGRIVNISSVAGRQGFPQRAVYSASKFAIIGLTQAMAQELASKDITVNAICPGPTATGRQQATRARLDAGDEIPHPRFTATSTPTGRLGVPEDIARTVVFLADPAASQITGQAINVDGGMFMN